MKFVVEPGPHKFQVPIDAGFGHIHEFGCLLCRKSEEEAQLDHAAFTLVHGFQFLEDALDVHDLGALRIDPGHALIERHIDAAIAFDSSFGPGLIDEDAAHQPRRKVVEMGAIFKSQTALANQPEEELVDDAGRLQEVFGALSTEKGTGDSPQLGIHQLEKMVDCCWFAITPLMKKDRYFTGLDQ